MFEQVQSWTTTTLALNSPEKIPALWKFTVKLCQSIYTGIPSTNPAKILRTFFNIWGISLWKISITCLMHESISHSESKELEMFIIDRCSSQCSRSDYSLYLPFRSVEVGLGHLLKIGVSMAVLLWTVTAPSTGALGLHCVGIGPRLFESCRSVLHRATRATAWDPSLFTWFASLRSSSDLCT